MTESVDQALRKQLKEAIGDDELTHKQKSMLMQKLGITTAFYTEEELTYWQMREEEEHYVRFLSTH
jgi:hypothetical protein